MASIRLALLGAAAASWLLGSASGQPQAPPVAPLPPGVRAAWDLASAYRQETGTRERICVNGLWRWQPARAAADAVPDGGWGWFKVPGPWPGIQDWLQKDCQTVYRHPAWQQADLAGVTAAWYQREVTVPAEWAGRRIALQADTLNSFAAVYVDGTKAGEVHFPGGELDVSSALRPGGTHVLSLLVVAMPLRGVMMSYTDSAHAREVKGTVARRGLCGDVWLVSSPAGPRLGDVRVDTSVREGRITVCAALRDLVPGKPYTLRAEVRAGAGVATAFANKAFAAADLVDGRLTFTHAWKPAKLWDLNTPQNTCLARLSLIGQDGKVLDTQEPVRFGFREFWIDGRDFYLNGTRIFLSAVPVDNAAIGAAWASYDGARESLRRLKSIGINYVYTHNYDCEPGSHLSFEELLRAADDVGMLVGLTQPHFSAYDWKAPDADRANGYARHAAFYARAAGSHPSVVAYVTSHNATGYDEDMNPDLIGGLAEPRDGWALNNVRLALRAAAIVQRLDPSRIVYHHASGNLGPMHDSNFYPNFAPAQELSDWFGHWATTGVKPAFTCEYGAPFTWDWTMYRGWYKGQREWGSAVVPWELCLAEWNAQFLGDRAYRITEAEKVDLRWEAEQFRAGRTWYRWDYPYQVSDKRFDDRHTVIAEYLTGNWRAFRTWGVSGISPWEHDHFWRMREGVDRGRKELKVDWDRLQRPGFSPDYLDQRFERFDLAYEPGDWEATADGQALLRNNRPLLAYIAGRPSRFTSKDHDFRAGETVEKQLVVINNSRATVECECAWSLDLPRRLSGRTTVTVPTGEQARIPLRIPLPVGLHPGACRLSATFRFSTGEMQADTFTLDVMASPEHLNTRTPEHPSARLALYDPKGETAALLKRLGVAFRPVGARDAPAGAGVLVIGKGALSVDGPAPDIGRVRQGLRVVVFEQSADALEKRLGLRAVEYGLRRVFARVPDHPLLAGSGAANLRDWRGSATLVPPQLRYTLRPMHGPTVKWCGIEVSRVWRCGCQGSVASVLIEKPARGDFLPIVDGGYSLQYSPLMEFREGTGMALFCQLDVTGRTESDPAADALVRSIMRYASAWRPSPSRRVLYAGAAAGQTWLAAAGVPVAPYGGGPLPAGQVLVVGPGGGSALGPQRDALSAWLQAGGRVLAIGLDQAEANAFLPSPIATRRAEHIAAWFAPAGAGTPLQGIAPADVHNRDPRELPLVASGASVVGDGVLAAAGGGRVVLCQMAPWELGPSERGNLRRTYRRTAFLVNRLLANLGAAGTTPLLAHFGAPAKPDGSDQRYLDGLYADHPQEWDDPYRFFRW